MSEKTEILEKLIALKKESIDSGMNASDEMESISLAARALAFADAIRIIESDTPSPALQDAVKEFQIDFGVHVRCHVEIRNGFIAVIMAVDGYGNPIESKDVFISPMQITSPSA